MLKYSKEIVLNLQGSGLRAASPLSVSCSACVFLSILALRKMTRIRFRLSTLLLTAFVATGLATQNRRSA